MHPDFTKCDRQYVTEGCGAKIIHRSTACRHAPSPSMFHMTCPHDSPFLEGLWSSHFSEHSPAPFRFFLRCPAAGEWHEAKKPWTSCFKNCRRPKFSPSLHDCNTSTYGWWTGTIPQLFVHSLICWVLPHLPHLPHL